MHKQVLFATAILNYSTGAVYTEFTYGDMKPVFDAFSQS